MNTTPGSDAPTNRRGGSPVSQAIAAAPPTTTEQSAAVRRAEDLAAVLADVHNIVADVHELTSGNAVVSLRRGLLAYTDGERFWWTSPERDDAGAPILSGELDLDQAAEQLAAHHALMAKRDAPDKPRDHAPRKGDGLDPVPRHLGAIAALKHLRTELHAHRIYPTISYDQGRPRLVISAELTVWADQAGTVFCWGACFLEEPADQAPADDVPQVARRIAGRLGKHYAEPVTPP